MAGHDWPGGEILHHRCFMLLQLAYKHCVSGALWQRFGSRLFSPCFVDERRKSRLTSLLHRVFVMLSAGAAVVLQRGGVRLDNSSAAWGHENVREIVVDALVVLLFLVMSSVVLCFAGRCCCCRSCYWVFVRRLFVAMLIAGHCCFLRHLSFDRYQHYWGLVLSVFPLLGRSRCWCSCWF